MGGKHYTSPALQKRAGALTPHKKNKQRFAFNFMTFNTHTLAQRGLRHCVVALVAPYTEGS